MCQGPALEGGRERPLGICKGVLLAQHVPTVTDGSGAAPREGELHILPPIAMLLDKLGQLAVFL